MKRIIIVVLVLVLSFSCFFYSWAEPSAKRRGGKFSLKDKVWAAQWINEKLSLLMEDGFIKRIKCYENDSNYEVFVSPSWRLMSTEEKSGFLRNLSRAREIVQHSPYLVVKDNDSGEVVAQVNEWGILIFGKEGEQFLPAVQQEEKDIGSSPQMEYWNNGVME